MFDKLDLPKDWLWFPLIITSSRSLEAANIHPQVNWSNCLTCKSKLSF